MHRAGIAGIDGTGLGPCSHGKCECRTRCCRVRNYEREIRRSAVGDCHLSSTYETARVRISRCDGLPASRPQSRNVSEDVGVGICRGECVVFWQGSTAVVASELYGARKRRTNSSAGAAFNRQSECEWGSDDTLDGADSVNVGGALMHPCCTFDQTF